MTVDIRGMVKEFQFASGFGRFGLRGLADSLQRGSRIGKDTDNSSLLEAGVATASGVAPLEQQPLQRNTHALQEPQQLGVCYRIGRRQPESPCDSLFRSARVPKNDGVATVIPRCLLKGRVSY